MDQMKTIVKCKLIHVEISVRVDGRKNDALSIGRGLIKKALEGAYVASLHGVDIKLGDPVTVEIERDGS